MWEGAHDAALLSDHVPVADLYESRLVRALALLDRAAIQRGKVYRLLEDGTYQEVTV